MASMEEQSQKISMRIEVQLDDSAVDSKRVEAATQEVQRLNEQLELLKANGSAGESFGSDSFFQTFENSAAEAGRVLADLTTSLQS